MTKDLKNNSKKPILLCILDGWGIGEDDEKVNAIFKAKTPNYDAILAKYPHSKLQTSGLAVGLPEGQMGNSEVGHITIGSGRVIYQNLPRINKAIAEGELAKNPDLQKLIINCKTHFKPCHLLGLLSDGGVHSHQNHIIYLAKIIAQAGVKVKVHAFLDGRDVAQKSAIALINNFENAVKDFPEIKIATISGRYYSMDRDNKWERTKLAYDLIVKNEGPRAKNAVEAVENSYKNNVTDEFILPTAIADFKGIEAEDALLVANFRADRIRQISYALLDPNFDKFTTKDLNFSDKIAMTQYSEELNEFFAILFPQVDVKNSLGEILEKHNLKQLRIAETEKYAHVTFFFSGGREAEFKGEDRILIKSPTVATYDLKPEMSAIEVGENLKKAINSGKYDFIVVNYANPDMVGHSGTFDSAVKACEIIDNQLGQLRDAILAKDGLMFITADHGNIENMVTHDHEPDTTHTTNPVPFILIGNKVSHIELKDGSLADITPTILFLMNFFPTAEMTGKILITHRIAL